MNKALVILTLALVAGLAVAPTAAASCPPTGVHFVCPPGSSLVQCAILLATGYVNLTIQECL